MGAFIQSEIDKMHTATRVQSGHHHSGLILKYVEYMGITGDDVKAIDGYLREKYSVYKEVETANLCKAISFCKDEYTTTTKTLLRNHLAGNYHSAESLSNLRRVARNYGNDQGCVFEELGISHEVTHYDAEIETGRLLNVCPGGSAVELDSLCRLMSMKVFLAPEGDQCVYWTTTRKEYRVASAWYTLKGLGFTPFGLSPDRCVAILDKYPEVREHTVDLIARSIDVYTQLPPLHLDRFWGSLSKCKPEVFNNLKRSTDL